MKRVWNLWLQIQLFTYSSWCGHQISVSASYIDGHRTNELVTSETTGKVENIDDTYIISGDLSKGGE